MLYSASKSGDIKRSIITKKDVSNKTRMGFANCVFELMTTIQVDLTVSSDPMG